MPRLLLINPNTNESTTAMMVAIGREALDHEGNSSAEAGSAPWDIEGVTAREGVPLITNEAALRVAAQAVVARLSECPLEKVAGIVIAAFGDPGLLEARAGVPAAIPVTGIAEAAMAEAPGRFAVVTTTPELLGSIEASAIAYGHGARFAGVRLTPGDPHTLMADPARLVEALAEACAEAIERDRVQSIVIGGGPLARAARDLRKRFSQPIVEPIPAAIRLALRRARHAKADAR